MNVVITSEILQAYSLCPRKAYLLMHSQERGELHEYEQILERHQLENQTENLRILEQKYCDVHLYSAENLKKGHKFLIDANLSTEKLQAYCPILKITDDLSYEPTIFIGNCKISNIDKLKLIFIGYVLAEIQGKFPRIGHIVNVKGESRRLKLEESHKVLTPLLAPLKEWTSKSSIVEAPVILNKHCSVCQFRKKCKEIAIQEDNLSLLDKVTPKVLRQYERKGVFTVKQLSYLSQPRKRKRRAKNPPPIAHSVELQALAIRTNKIYLRELPTLNRQKTELYLDVEGIPDKNLQYLFGLLICQCDEVTYHSFWADTMNDEEEVWRKFLDFIDQYPTEPIYHYGSYESRAIKMLSKRYETESKSLIDRLVNVNKQIYGQMYFPTYSNQLKDIARHLGFAWTSANASGLTSLVWRHHWDIHQDGEYKTKLLKYNEEDCHALKRIVDKVVEITESVNELPEVDFVDDSLKETSGIRNEVHSQFDVVLKFASLKYEKKKISFQDISSKQNAPSEVNKKSGVKKGYQGQRRTRPMPSKVSQVPPAKCCPKCENGFVRITEKLSKRLIIDLVLTRAGIKKTITEYVGKKVYCGKCNRLYSPPEIRRFERTQMYGHGVKAWFVYHRVALRLPYEQSANSFREQFNEPISWEYTPAFIKSFSHYYDSTEKSIETHLLKSPLIHADETPINIRGETYYVWVFTTSDHVIFKLAETREASLVHEFLKDFSGILVSDFYGGYDSINCRQQKCWVHLIRDLNNTLWKFPDDDYERFVLEVKKLIVPIMEAISKYGLKKRNLRKFKSNVDWFYKEFITDHFYKSEPTQKFQKRFHKYKDSLFTFLEFDDVPWHNNRAERAIRHLAKQRAISGNFHKNVTEDYLRLLGIMQTCRFQNKSFFKFLFSAETDLDKFKPERKKRDIKLISAALNS